MSDEQQLFQSLVEKFKSLNDDGPAGQESFRNLLQQMGYDNSIPEKGRDGFDDAWYEFVRWALSKQDASSLEASVEAQKATVKHAGGEAGTSEQAMLAEPQPCEAMLAAEPQPSQPEKETATKTVKFATAESGKVIKKADSWLSVRRDSTWNSDDPVDWETAEEELLFYDLCNPFELSQPQIVEAMETSQTERSMRNKETTKTGRNSVGSEFWQDTSAVAGGPREHLMLEESSQRTYLKELEAEDAAAEAEAAKEDGRAKGTLDF